MLHHIHILLLFFLLFCLTKKTKATVYETLLVIVKPECLIIHACDNKKLIYNQNTALQQYTYVAQNHINVHFFKYNHKQIHC